VHGPSHLAPDTAAWRAMTAPCAEEPQDIAGEPSMGSLAQDVARPEGQGRPPSETERLQAKVAAARRQPAMMRR